MAEYIPKDKVLELWWYWKFIEAYDKTAEMEGIELDDYVPKEWHDRVCEEMAKHHTADRPKWIPCSERLPEHEVVVLVTDEYGDVDMASIERFSRRPDPWQWCDKLGYLIGYDIVAWMPLPEPWKEDNDE